MIAVADTSPLNYLILVGSQDVLPRLFGALHAPPAVIEEMKDPRAPENVRNWAESPPSWAIVQAPSRADSRLGSHLHRGEVEAISLALELSADWILLDDWHARVAAKDLDLAVVGTMNILEEAAVRGMLDVDVAVAGLRRTNYRATEAQYQALFENVRARTAGDDDR